MGREIERFVARQGGGVDRIGVVMRSPVVEVERAMLLPQLDGEDGIKHVHVRHLDVTAVEVIP